MKQKSTLFKFKRLFLLATVCLLATSGIAQTVIFEDTFDSLTGTSSPEQVAPSGTAALTTYGNWSLSYMYPAKECIKGGSSSKQGIITTPALVNLSGNAVLTFRAAAWTNDAKELLLEITGGGTLSVSSVQITDSEFTSFSVNILNGTSSSKITFKGKTASKGRFFLDDVKVTLSSGETTGLLAPALNFTDLGTGAQPTTPFLEQASYEITNPNATGAIFYSIDDTNWNEYTTAVTLTNSCTLKAKIKDGEEESAIATIEVDILPKENTFTTLVDLKAKGTHATDFIGFTPEDFHYVSGGKKNYYILKGGEMMLVFGSNLFPENLKTGDQLTGKFIGNYIDFNGKSEIANVQIAQPIRLTEANISIDPTISVLTADQIAADYAKHEHKLITVIGLQPKSDIDYSKVAYGEYVQGENTLIVRNTLKDLTSKVSASKTYNITGHLGIYSKDGKTEYQIYPRSEADIVESTGTSINSSKDNTFAISMTNGAVVITTNIETTVRIFQTSGQLVKTTTIPAGDTTIALPSGVYIINGKKAVVL